MDSYPSQISKLAEILVVGNLWGIHSFIHSFIHLLIHSFIHSSLSARMYVPLCWVLRWTRWGRALQLWGPEFRSHVNAICVCQTIHNIQPQRVETGCGVLVRASIAVNRHHDHDNCYRGQHLIEAGLPVHRSRLLSSWQENWQRAGSHGAREGAESFMSWFSGSRDCVPHWAELEHRP